jgi:hypothetical protein
LHAVTSPKLSIVTKVLVQTASARVDTLSTRAAAGLALSWRETERACATVPLLCRSGPLLSLGAHAHAHAHCKQKSCALRSVAVPRTQARAKLVAEVVRAAWLFCGRYPELHPFSVPPASQEFALACMRRAPAYALNREAWSAAGIAARGAASTGRTNAHEGCGARLRRRQSSERPGHDV